MTYLLWLWRFVRTALTAHTRIRL